MLVVLAASHLLAATPAPGRADHRMVEYRDGRLFVPPGVYSVAELLDQISKAAGFEIVIIGNQSAHEPIAVSYNGSKPEQVIQSLLKGCSYAIINRGQSSTMSLSSAAKTAERLNSAMEPPAHQTSLSDTEGIPGVPEKEQELLHRIEELQKRLESGISDQSYEIWSSVRDPNFVIHEGDLLEQYEQELADLRSLR